MKPMVKIILGAIAIAVLFYGLGIVSAKRFNISADDGIIQSPPPTINPKPTVSPAILNEPCYQLQKGIDDATNNTAISFNIDEQTLLAMINQSAEIVSSDKDGYNWQQVINPSLYQNEDQYIAGRILGLFESKIKDKIKDEMENYAKSLVGSAPTDKYQSCASKLNTNPYRSGSASSDKKYNISYKVGSGGAYININSAKVVTTLGMGMDNVLSNLGSGKSINSGVNFNIAGSIKTGSNSGLIFGYTSKSSQIPVSATWRISF